MKASAESNGSAVSVWSVKYGERVVHKSDVFHDYAQYGVPDGDLEMDYNFWVIRSQGKIILLDTGYDIPKRDWLGEISVTPTPDGLDILGIDPADVSMVITSHYHYDHIGYLALFTNAQIVSAQAEYDYWISKLRADDLEGEFSTEDDLQPVLEAEAQGRLRLVTEKTEVFPGITVYPIGGHCPGELLTKVETAGGGLILTVDAAHFYEQIEHEWPFFAFTDLDEMKRGLSFINELSRTTGATIVPGHDARVRGRFPAAAGAAGQIATVLA
ncbi:N-acyl homoserine lactonase family protein [Microbacterium sp. STN6]|uniref:N-acyl homoserine lactonase family protein n=1 Tax=Microbacterium sp. STN6 TaxID=2995588 RepID=UPI002260C183|nr:N-acyl homoserine lactonase family protein [Microbacterium sp. STN6]MCX7521009.1 N-acyl homoserine lactonase family protein [Microbacterium sp. STN6]